MEILDKAILTEILISSFSKDQVGNIVKGGKIFPENFLNSKINSLVEKGLINSDKKTLSEIGRTSLKVVLSGGVFDIIHPGHIHTLYAAKLLGDVLVVVVATDKTAEKMKKRVPIHNQKLRCQLVNSLKIVDLCIIGEEGDIFQTVKKVKPQIIALGYDQIHQEKFITEGCRKLNLEIKVARLQSPVPEISSRDLEKQYGKNIHDL